jgi:hypothetical protein
MASDSRDIERMLEKVEPPRVVAGVHRDRLREEIIETMHGAQAAREDARRAGARRWIMRGYRSDSLAARLAWACTAIGILGAVAWGAGQAMQRVRKSYVVYETPPTVVRTPDGGTRVTGVWSGAFMASDDPNVTEEDVRRRFELIERAKATGKATVVKRQETDFGTVVTYRTRLDDGRDVTWAGSPEDVMTPGQRTERHTQLSELLAARKFEFVRKFTTPDGVTMYSYRVRMPDGTSVRHASILPDHDPEQAKQLQQEIDRAKAEHKGTLVSVVEPLKGVVLPKGMEPPRSARMYMYKVKLSNGDVTMYSTPDPPAKAGAK